ncbi:transglutaminase-like domain-containing protein [Microbulbifer sediminum]|uniref:transglutaminase-like domain-containing protein n=1 Tax=Microbulbifer sediminum TaxID=2904250 RepID=UPI001F38EAF2|nr:transglutaminase-like domain-containing protein [Microbulbifer sediminum]
MRGWLPVLLLAAIMVLPELLLTDGLPDPESRIDPQLQQKLSLEDNGNTRASRDSQRGQVRVNGSSRPITEQLVQKMVARRSEAESAYVSIWNWQGISNVTASARGLDSKHHFANSYLVGFQPFETDKLWVPLYSLATRKQYQYDHLQYAGLSDIWQTSRQAYYQPRGDCEDHAILLADWLINLGVDARVAMGTHRGQGHAWVVAIVDNREYLLEATSKRRQTSWQAMPLAALAEGYDVEFQFNREFFWAKKSPAPTRRYRGNHWVMKSRFIRG